MESALLSTAKHTRLDSANIALEYRLDSIVAAQFASLSRKRAMLQEFRELTAEYEEAQRIVAERRADLARAQSLQPVSLVA